MQRNVRSSGKKEKKKKKIPAVRKSVASGASQQPLSFQALIDLLLSSLATQKDT